MKFIDQRVKLVAVSHENPIEAIAKAYRVCYRSQSKDHRENLIMINSKVRLGHLTPLEHVTATFFLVTDRGVMAELTRHRLASFNVQSTRYLRQEDGVEFTKPIGFSEVALARYERAMKDADKHYRYMLKDGARPEQARAVLPNATTTRIIMTANLREWLHIFKLRCHKTAHPQMVDLMKEVKKQLVKEIPEVLEWADILGG